MISLIYGINFYTDQHVDDHEVWVEKVKELSAIIEVISLTYFIMNEEREVNNIFRVNILLGDKGYEESNFSVVKDILTAESNNSVVLLTTKSDFLSGKYTEFDKSMEIQDKIDKILSRDEYSNSVHNSELRNTLIYLFNKKPNSVFFNLMDLLNWMGNKYVFPPQQNIELYTIKEKILSEEEKVRKRDEEMIKMEGGNT